MIAEDSDTKQYTITEAAKISGLPESTLRYYESIAIIHPIERDSSTKRRVYSDDDINLIVAIACLNATGLSIEHMKQYLQNREKGALGADEQVKLLDGQLDHLQEEMRYMQLRTRYVESKIKYWKAVAAGDDNAVAVCATETYQIADEMKLPKTIASIERDDMKFMKSSNTSTNKGPQDWFTGDVYIDGIRNPDEQSAIGAAHVRFTPAARTAWHHHPKGQTLYVTDGIGYVCRRGSTPELIKPGDVVYIEPGEEHWHGATADHLMAHVAMQEADQNGEVVTWLEHVMDNEFLAGK